MPDVSWRAQAAKHVYPMTQANINNAVRADLQRCPIALALKDSNLDVLVNPNLAVIHEPGCVWSCRLHRCEGTLSEEQATVNHSKDCPQLDDCTPLLLLPSDEVAAFIDAFDNEQFVEPKSLRIALYPDPENDVAHGALYFEGEK